MLDWILDWALRHRILIIGLLTGVLTSSLGWSNPQSILFWFIVLLAAAPE